MQLIQAGCLVPKKINMVPFARKITTSDFWDAKVILLIDCLEKDTTITWKYYCNRTTIQDANVRDNTLGFEEKKRLPHGRCSYLQKRLGDRRIE